MTEKRRGRGRGRGRPRNTEPMRTISASFPLHVYKLIKEVADIEGRSPSQFMRDSVIEKTVQIWKELECAASLSPQQPEG